MGDVLVHLMVLMRQDWEGEINKLAARVAALENSGPLERIAARESLPSVENWYRGVWTKDAEYLRGQGVTFRGSIFVAQQNSKGQQPELSPAWQLAVKRGQNGKDLRPPNGATS